MEASDKPTKLVSIRIIEIDVTKLSVKLNGEFVVLCIKKRQSIKARMLFTLSFFYLEERFLFLLMAAVPINAHLLDG